MNGTVTYFYLPVPDLKAARTFYRDTLALEEAWREGDTTCAFVLPGTTVQLMLDQASPGDLERAGLVFTVPDTRALYQEKQGQLQFHREPSNIPGGGLWVGADDGQGHSVYAADVQ